MMLLQFLLIRPLLSTESRTADPGSPDPGTISIGRTDINHPAAFRPDERAAQLGVEIGGAAEGELPLSLLYKVHHYYLRH